MAAQERWEAEGLPGKARGKRQRGPGRTKAAVREGGALPVALQPKKGREAKAGPAARIPQAAPLPPSLENKNFTWRECLFSTWKCIPPTLPPTSHALMPSPFRGAGSAVQTLVAQPSTQAVMQTVGTFHGTVPSLAELSLIALAPSLHLKSCGGNLLGAGMPKRTLNLLMRWGASARPTAPLPHVAVTSAIMEGQCNILALDGHGATSRSLHATAAVLAVPPAPLSPAADAGWEEAAEAGAGVEGVPPALRELYCTWACQPLVKGGLVALLRSPPAAALQVVDLTGTPLAPRRAPVLLAALGACADLRLISLAGTGLCSVGAQVGLSLGQQHLPHLAVLDLRHLNQDKAYVDGALTEGGPPCLAHDFDLSRTLVLLQTPPPPDRPKNTFGFGAA